MAQQVRYGPRLIAHPTDRLRSALLIAPNAAMERVAPLQSEPSAIFSRAAEQHATLVKTLQYFGVETRVVDAHDRAAFAACANDLAVVFENGAVIMRPHDLDRRAETDLVRAQFDEIDIPTSGEIAVPGLLDGSDVLLAGNTAFIGVSKRSNAIGRAGLAQIAAANGYRAVDVKLTADAPCLRSVANTVAPGTVVIAPDKVDGAAFEGFDLIELERGEDLGAGFLTIGQNHILCDVRYSFAHAQLRKTGIAVEAIDLYEFGKLGITPTQLVLPLRRR